MSRAVKQLRGGRNPFYYLDVPVVWNSIQDRWFIVNKPPGYSVEAASRGPSLEASLQPFSPRRLLFPSRLDKDAQGLVPVATDPHTKGVLATYLKEGRVRQRYRVLADASKGHGNGTSDTRGSGLSSSNGSSKHSSCGVTSSGSPSALGAAEELTAALPFLCGSRRHTLWGALFAPDGRSLLERGVLRSRLGKRPPKLRLYHPVDDRPDADTAELLEAVLEEASRARGESPPPSGRQQRGASSEWQRNSSSAGGILDCMDRKRLQRLLGGEEVPAPLINTLSKSLLAHSVDPPDALQPGAAAVRQCLTEFVLLSACHHPPGSPFLRTALYLAEPRGSGQGPHQLRAQFAEAGCPLLGDVYYHPAFDRDTVANVTRAPTPPPISMAASMHSGQKATEADEGSSTCSGSDDPHSSSDGEGEHPSHRSTGSTGGGYHGSLGLQLCSIELPDPLGGAAAKTIRVECAPPADWVLLHPELE